jgi:hypothetical protein
MAATFNKFNNFTKALGDKLHNLGTDTFFFQLTNTVPVATNSIETDLAADLSTANGYTAGGLTLGTGTWTTASGTAKLVITDKVFTAAGGAVGPFRYVTILNNTATNKDLIGWYDYGSSITLNDTETLTLDFDGAAGVLTIV